MKQFLDKHDINIYSIFGEHKSAIIERFNRNLKQLCGNVSQLKTIETG